jgi:uncharacterized RDD family membrane protein YckC
VRTRTEYSWSGRRARYADPGSRYVARYATPWRRAVAATVDWALCFLGFLVVSIPLGVVQALGQISWEEGDLGGGPGHILFLGAQILTVAPVIAYFTVLWPTSETLGQRVSGLRIISTESGRGISRRRALVHAVVTTVLAAGVYAVFLVGTAFDKGDTLDHRSAMLLDVAYVLAGVAAASALTMMVTPTRRSLLDRLFGTAVLDELEAVNPHMGPWGPLDAFDTSR